MIFIISDFYHNLLGCSVKDIHPASLEKVTTVIISK